MTIGKINNIIKLLQEIKKNYQDQSLPQMSSSVVQSGQENSPPLRQASQPQAEWAGFWVRAAALVIDSFVLGLPIYAVSALIAFLLGQPSLLSEDNSILNLLAIIFGLPTIVFFVTRFGATPGKMCFGLKIITADGTYPKVGRALLRETVGKFISGLILSLGYLWVAFDKEKQAVHDKIAGTHVILTKPIVGFRKIVVFLIGFLFLLVPILGILAVSILVAINPAKKINQARDASRKNDIVQISMALQSYHTQNSIYPKTLNELVTSKTISSLPTDPTLKTSYLYSVTTDGSRAAVYATLEKGNMGDNSVYCWTSFSTKAVEVVSVTSCRP